MYKKNDNIVARRIHDTFFLINIKDNYWDEKCRLYELNEIGYLIWKKLDIHNDILGISVALIEGIDDEVEPSIIYKDVKAFIELLVQEKFVEVIDGRD